MDSKFKMDEDISSKLAGSGYMGKCTLNSNNPCYIMCIDGSGKLLRIPMSVLQKSSANILSTDINSSQLQQHLILQQQEQQQQQQQDKQKAPVAVIAPWNNTSSKSSDSLMFETLQQDQQQFPKQINSASQLIQQRLTNPQLQSQQFIQQQQPQLSVVESETQVQQVQQQLVNQQTLTQLLSAIQNKVIIPTNQLRLISPQKLLLSNNQQNISNATTPLDIRTGLTSPLTATSQQQQIQFMPIKNNALTFLNQVVVSPQLKVAQHNAFQHVTKDVGYVDEAMILNQLLDNAKQQQQYSNNISDTNFNDKQSTMLNVHNNLLKQFETFQNDSSPNVQNQQQVKLLSAPTATKMILDNSQAPLLPSNITVLTPQKLPTIQRTTPATILKNSDKGQMVILTNNNNIILNNINNNIIFNNNHNNNNNLMGSIFGLNTMQYGRISGSNMSSIHIIPPPTTSAASATHFQFTSTRHQLTHLPAVFKQNQQIQTSSSSTSSGINTNGIQGQHIPPSLTTAPTNILLNENVNNSSAQSCSNDESNLFSGNHRSLKTFLNNGVSEVDGSFIHLTPSLEQHKQQSQCQVNQQSLQLQQELQQQHQHQQQSQQLLQQQQLHRQQQLQQQELQQQLQKHSQQQLQQQHLQQQSEQQQSEQLQQQQLQNQSQQQSQQQKLQQQSQQQLQQEQLQQKSQQQLHQQSQQQSQQQLQQQSQQQLQQQSQQQLQQQSQQQSQLQLPQQSQQQLLQQSQQLPQHPHQQQHSQQQLISQQQLLQQLSQRQLQQQQSQQQIQPQHLQQQSDQSQYQLKQQLLTKKFIHEQQEKFLQHQQSPKAHNSFAKQKSSNLIDNGQTNNLLSTSMSTNTTASSPITTKSIALDLKADETSKHDHICVDPSTTTASFVTGQEYHLVYSTGLQVYAVWDGKYFKVKSQDETSTSVPSSIPSSQTTSLSSTDTSTSVPPAVSSLIATISSTTVSLSTDSTTLSQHELPTNADNISPALQDSNISEQPENRQKALKRPKDEVKFAICRRCGGASSNFNKCINCNHALPANVEFFYPDMKKKFKLSDNCLNTDDNNDNEYILCNNNNSIGNSKQSNKRHVNNINLSAQSNVDNHNGKNFRKNIIKRYANITPKREAEVVHILSSDDEDDHSTDATNNFSASIKNVHDQQDDLTKSSQHLMSTSSLTSCISMPFSGFRLQVKVVYFGKICCSWLNLFTFDRKSVNFICSSINEPTFNLSTLAPDVTLVATYFDKTNKCTHLFLQANHTSAIKLFSKIFPNAELLYNPLSKDDCVKYIVLFLDDNQMNLQEVIPKVVESMQLYNNLSNNDNDKQPAYKTIENFDEAAFLKSVEQCGNPILNKESALMVRLRKDEDHEDGHYADDPMGEQVMNTFVNKIINLFTYPPPPATGGITVTNEDLFCLNEGEFLNDVIIDFYLKYLATELYPEKFKNAHIFSSFFYRRLTQKIMKKFDDDQFANMNIQQRRHAHVRTWTRHVDLFSKDFVVVPINESAHWFLAVICFPGCKNIEIIKNNILGTNSNNEKVRGRGRRSRMQPNNNQNIVIRKMPCILIFDSLAGPTRNSVIKLLREYLQVEWDMKMKAEHGQRIFNKDTMRGGSPECPQQTNFSDCGIYILQYVQSFFTDPIENYSFPIRLTKWFDETMVCQKRNQLQHLIIKMQNVLNPSLEYNPEMDGCVINRKEDPLPDFNNEKLLDVINQTNNDNNVMKSINDS